MTAAEKRKKSNIRLVSGFFADLVTDTRANPPVHHWIVQREGWSDVVHWGQETTLAAAEGAATSFLNELAERERRKNA